MPNIPEIITKAQSSDRDYRYMACSDLLSMLQSETARMDADQERQLSTIMLQHVDDTAGDISSLAVRCLALLVVKSTPETIGEVITTLCKRVTGAISSKKHNLHESAMIALKTIVGQLPATPNNTAATTVITTAVPLLVEGIYPDLPTEVLNAALESLSEILAKGGALTTTQHKDILTATMAVLQEGKPTSRKRAIQCLGNLSAHLANDTLDTMLNTLLTQLGQSGSSDDLTKTYILAVGAISKAITFRCGRYLPRAVPCIVQHCKAGPLDDDEMREHCLQTLESFITRSPFDMRPFVVDGGVLDLALELLGYDPNYVDDMVDDDDDDANGDDYDVGSEEEDYSDDEDMSWKVRRAAAKCLGAILDAYPEAVERLYHKIAPRLVERFREREEQVKGDVFATYTVLLHAIATAGKRYTGDSMVGPVGLLLEDAPTVLNAASRQLREKSQKTRIGALSVLLQLVQAVPGCLRDHVGALVPGIQAALQDKSSSASQLKLTALEFLSAALEASDPVVFEGHAESLAPPVFEAVGERYYKVSAEALRVCRHLMRAVRPDATQALADKHKALVHSLIACLLPRVSAPDVDQEVKEAAIACAAAVVASASDIAPKETQQLLVILSERLKNETTRVAAVRAFSVVGVSPLRPDLGGVLQGVLEELTGFLRKANRQVKQASLAAQEELVRHYGAIAPSPTLEATVKEAATLVDENDLLLSAHALQLMSIVLQQQPTVATSVTATTLPASMQLVQSPLLQGSVLKALQQFFNTLAATTNSGAAIEEQLLAVGSAETIPRAAQGSMASCVSSLVVAGGEGHISKTVGACLNTIANSNSSPAATRLALLVLGKIGRLTDLSSYQGIDNAVHAALASPSEEVATAASKALGEMAVGSPTRLLPYILSQIRAASGKPKQQYLLLKSLNDVLLGLSEQQQRTGAVNLTETQQKEVLALLFSDTDAEEQCRIVVAECLGHLTLLCPEQITGSLLHNASAASPSMRQVVIIATRFMVVGHGGGKSDDRLKELLTACLPAMSDKDRHVRKAALQTLTAALHHKPQLVVDSLPSLLLLVYEQVKIDPSLVRTVDLGPFKHQIDDGLELRKTAFECLDVMLDVCPQAVDIDQHVATLQSGLGDHNDIKMPCHLLLTKITTIAPAAVLRALDKLVEPLQKTLTTRPKSDAVKQELDRHEDMLKSCLRAIDSISRIDNVSSCVPFQTMMDKVVMAGGMKQRFKDVQRERAEVDGDAGGLENMEM